MKFENQDHRGPSRNSRAEADADLHAMRNTSTREEMLRVVAMLCGPEVAADDCKLLASQPASASAAATPSGTVNPKGKSLQRIGWVALHRLGSIATMRLG